MKLENRRYKKELQLTDEQFVVRDNTFTVIKAKDGNIDMVFSSPEYENIMLKLTKTGILQNKPIDGDAIEIHSNNNIELNFEDTKVLYLYMDDDIVVDDIVNIEDDTEYHLYIKQGEETSYTFEINNSLNLVFDGEFSYDDTLDSVTHISLIKLDDEIYVKSYYEYKKHNSNQYIINIDTTKTNKSEFGLNIIEGYEYDFVVDWGDGSSNHITTWDDENKRHTYDEHGEYKIVITGLVQCLRAWYQQNNIISAEFNNIGDLQDVIALFSYTQNLESFTTKSDDWCKDVIYMNSIFTSCNSPQLKLSPSTWNVSNVENMEYVFSYMPNRMELDLSKWDVSNVTDMSYMFYNSNLNLNLSDWDVKNVTNMTMMFAYSPNVEYLNLSNWKMGNVVMNNMFYNNTTLNNLNLDGWDVSNVTDMSNMFYGCTNLETINTKQWDLSNTNVDNMFNNCTSLKFIDVIEWELNNTINMSNMFYQCENLKGIDITQWDVSQSTSHGEMGIINLYNLSAIAHNYDDVLNAWSKLDVQENVFFYAGLAKYSMKGVEARNYLIKEKRWTIIDEGMVDNYSSFEFVIDTSLGDAPTFKLPLPNFKMEFIEQNNIHQESRNILKYDFFIDWGDGTSNVIKKHDALETLHTYDEHGEYDIKIYGLLEGWRFIDYKGDVINNDNIKITKVNKLGYTGVKDAFGMFAQNVNLTLVNNIDYNNDWSKHVDDFSYLFYNNTSLNNINVDRLVTSNIKYLKATFKNNNFNTSITTSNWDMSNVRFTNHLFQNCVNLLTFDYSNWEINNIVNTSYMFQMTAQLNVDIDFSDWNTSNLIDASYMFNNSYQIGDVDMSNWDTSKLKYMSNMFNSCHMKILNLSNWDTSNVVDMSNAFDNTVLITELHLKNWTIHDIHEIFYSQKYSLQYLDVRDTKINKPTNMEALFEGHSNLHTILGLDSWDMSEVITTERMFAFCNSLTELNLSGWDVSNVTDSYMMFMGCSSLETINLTGWNPTSLIESVGMFQGCSSLEYVDVDNWTMENAEEISEMFDDCIILENVDVSGWDISNLYEINCFANSPAIAHNYDDVLNAWAALDVQYDVYFNAGLAKYSDVGEDARNCLINEKGWTITDQGKIE